MTRRIVDVDDDLALLRDSLARCEEQIEKVRLSDEDNTQTLDGLIERFEMLEASLLAAEGEPVPPWVKRYAKAVAGGLTAVLPVLGSIYVDGPVADAVAVLGALLGVGVVVARTRNVPDPTAA